MVIIDPRHSQSAQISQNVIMKTMCPPGYHNGFGTIHALGHMMYIYIYIYI